MVWSIDRGDPFAPVTLNVGSSEVGRCFAVGDQKENGNNSWHQKPRVQGVAL